MNTTYDSKTILQGLAAAVAALGLTWALSWSFVDSTRVARWVSAADVAATSVDAARDSSALARSFKAGLLQ